jgi:multidrug efflux pump subunit AcrA (membrane-fusion protein)
MRRLGFRSRLLYMFTLFSILILSSACQDQTTSTPTPVDSGLPSLRDTYVSATGRVLPETRAELSFGFSGIVREVHVVEGDRVTQGRLLAVIDAPELQTAPDQARAALHVAEADLARLEVGARAQEIRQAQVLVALGEEQVAAAEQAVEVAAAQEATAMAAIEAAEAALRQVRAGPTTDELEILRRQIDQSKSLLYASQGQRDALGGLKGSPGYQVGSFESAEGQVLANEEAVRIAELRLKDLSSRPRPSDVAVVAAQVTQARAGLEVAAAQRRAAEQQVAVARRQLEQAEAQLALVEAPVRETDLDVARARVEQAQVALESAEASADNTIIRAPFDGVITNITLRQGEYVMMGQPILSLGDLDSFRVETTDLDEIDIARIDIGDTVLVTFDALPRVEAQGTVTRIALKSSAGVGGTTYETIITLQGLDPRLRWGMTAFVDIEVD